MYHVDVVTKYVDRTIFATQIHVLKNAITHLYRHLANAVAV